MKIVIVLFVVAYLIFLGVASIPAAMGHLAALTPFLNWAPSSQAIIKLLLIVVSLGLMRMRPVPLSAYGFRRPEGFRWIAGAIPGALIGAAATLCILFLGLPGLKSVMMNYGVLNVILWVWIVSSVSEEIFIRGWFQTELVLRGVAPQVVIAASALLFGSMHAPLYFKGIDAGSVTIICISTFLLGIFTARLRSRYDSLIPAIAAHVAFNVAGMVAGIAFVIVKIASGGHI